MKTTIGKKRAFQAERSIDLNPDPKVYQKWEIRDMAHGLQSVITKLAEGKLGFWKLKLNQEVNFQLTETSRKNVLLNLLVLLTLKVELVSFNLWILKPPMLK